MADQQDQLSSGGSVETASASADTSKVRGKSSSSGSSGYRKRQSTGSIPITVEEKRRRQTYFGNINVQIQEVCHQLLKDKYLKNGYNAIGFSQGAQFFRALIQRCPNPSVKNFISLGGQHQGIFGLPNCGILKPDICHHLTRIIKYGAYLEFIQKKFIQATYWHDPYHEEEYKEKSTFLADINNEHYINKTYIKNLQNYIPWY